MKKIADTMKKIADGILRAMLRNGAFLHSSKVSIVRIILDKQQNYTVGGDGFRSRKKDFHIFEVYLHYPASLFSGTYSKMSPG